MAIYHLSLRPVARASGRSAVAAAAYRAAARLENGRDGLVHDFTRRGGVVQAEVVLPAGVDAGWARERSALWNAAELAEKRKDARVAREVEVALPYELSAEQRLALARELAQGLADRYGVAVDLAVHAPHGMTDVRNHHAHLLLTTRKVGADGLGEKSTLELEDRKLRSLGLPSAREQLRAIRADWAERANAHLAWAGADARVDHRSHAARGIGLEPTRHMGVQATGMVRRGEPVARARLEEGAGQHNARLIAAAPEQVLALVSSETSVFGRRDVARALHRCVDEPEAFQAALAKVMASPELVELQPEQRDAHGRTIEPARYATREMVALEHGMAVGAERLAGAGGFAVPDRQVEAALRARSFLSEEQQAAVAHVTGAGRLAVVVGLAGAGKSTTLAAARAAWETGGLRVHGAALAGKAAEGLEEASGIPSRTLASWERSWARGFERLGPSDVLVVDEAGMVGSRQLAGIVAEAEQAGAKLVLVGDPEQLQPIGPGAAFRAVAERVGVATLGEVRRQHQEWQRQASVDLGRHRTAAGLAAYAEHGAIRFAPTTERARAALVAEVLADMAARPGASRLALAHRRVDVCELNEAIRAGRRERGALGSERTYRTTEGERAFAVGDRVLFGANDRALGVRNGMLGTVAQAEAGRLVVRLDAAAGPGAGRAVAVPVADYPALAHGYATTIHKAQGATVDRAFVLASTTMDRHLTYVALTRHREAVTLHAGRDAFADLDALTTRLARSGAKATTLDYAGEHDPSSAGWAAYAARRGIEAVAETIEARLQRLRQAVAGQRGSGWEQDITARLRALHERHEPRRAGQEHDRAATVPQQERRPDPAASLARQLGAHMLAAIERIKAQNRERDRRLARERGRDDDGRGL